VKLGNFDSKTSSWLKTLSDVRELGGAIFGDYRYGRVFTDRSATVGDVQTLGAHRQHATMRSQNAGAARGS